MRPGKTLAVALPGAAALALWRGYRHAVQEFRSLRQPPDRLPGRVYSVPTSWGRLSYRMVHGSNTRSPLVMIHGWGRSADSAWWPLLEQTGRTVLALDLPGHGRSQLEQRFRFDLATDAVCMAIEHAGLQRPVLVGHSMGGPISLQVIRAAHFEVSGLVAIATSAYWVSPQVQLIVAAAPYVLAPNSPLVAAAMREEERHAPESRAQVARSYGLRPSRKVLAESAWELRRFDARKWGPMNMPPTMWVVTSEDGVIPQADQLASARLYQAPVEVLHSDHAVLMSDPERVAGIIEALAPGRRRESVRPKPRLVRAQATP